VVAEDEEAVVGVELLVGSGGNLAHRDQGASFNAGGCVFDRFADVDEFCLALFEQTCGVEDGDFIFVCFGSHEDRILFMVTLVHYEPFNWSARVIEDSYPTFYFF